MRIIKQIILGLFLLGTVQIMAQDPVTPKEKAEHYFKNEGYYTAIDFYKFKFSAVMVRIVRYRHTVLVFIAADLNICK